MNPNRAFPRSATGNLQVQSLGVYLKLVGWVIPFRNSKCGFSAHAGQYLAALMVEGIPCQVGTVKSNLRLHV